LSVSEPNLYQLLEVEESAGDREIALAFRRVAKRWHPDLNSTLEATERMQRISAAYEVLRDPERRADYDRALHPVVPTAEPDDGQAGWEPSETERWASWTTPGCTPIVVADPRAPVGFATPPHPFSIRHRRQPGNGCSSRARLGRSACGQQAARAMAIACVLVCPSLVFLLAAARGRDGSLARWGLLYALAPLLWELSSATGSRLLFDAAVVVLLVGVAHAAWWRERLGTLARRRRAGA